MGIAGATPGSPARRCSCTWGCRRYGHPGYLCYGYPQRGAGEFDRAEKITTDNRVLFHRVANTLNSLDIRTVRMSCGTCYDQLLGYKFEEIFPARAPSTSTSTRWKRTCSWRGSPGRVIYIPRSLPLAHESLRCAEGRQLADERGVQPPYRNERPLLRGVRHAGADAAGCIRTSAVPQGGGDARWNREVPLPGASPVQSRC